MNAAQADTLMKRITSVGPHAPSAAERQQLLRGLQTQCPEMVEPVQEQLLHQVDSLNRALLETKVHLDALRESHERLTKPPWLEATFCLALSDEQQALVQVPGGRRVVSLAEEVDLDALEPGDDVLLNGDTNVLMCRSPWGSPRGGETAAFQRRLDERRILLRSRDDEFVAEIAGPLAGIDLTEGDLVLWSRETRFAWERIERTASRRYFVSDPPDVKPEQIGGQRAAVQAFLAALTAVLSDPATAARYGLQSGRKSILLIGPPGCGKTLLARLGASQCALLSGKKCQFMVVKPGEWVSKYVGQTEENIRSCFQSLGQAAAEGYVVLFLDEVESIGRARGDAVGHHSDKFVAALLAELDGFASRGNVAIVAATNRKELLDPALYERLSDVEVTVPRPNREGAKEIFLVHFAEHYPYFPNGAAARDTRAQIVDRSVSLLYNANTGNEVCVARFADASERTITAGELMSGRVIEQISRAARQRAFLREVHQGAPGIIVEDAEESVADAIDRLATTLTPLNIRSYLHDLSDDMAVRSVRPIVRRARRLHRYRS